MLTFSIFNNDYAFMDWAVRGWDGQSTNAQSPINPKYIQKTSKERIWKAAHS